MTREEKVREARRLRAEGLTRRAIGERMGVTQAAVTKWLNPNAAEWARRDNARRRADKREWERAYRADPANRKPCPRCGGPTWRSRNRSADPVLCSACIHADHEKRERRIAEMWLAGATHAEIAAALGSTPASVQVGLSRMRRAGWDLPRRGPGGRTLEVAA
jgi:transposase